MYLPLFLLPGGNQIGLYTESDQTTYLKEERGNKASPYPSILLHLTYLKA
ncbi:MAG: hypothetical protein ACI8P3_003823 [Saprospiraceae bacterium]|jgi:hypothetical protein